MGCGHGDWGAQDGGEAAQWEPNSWCALRGMVNEWSEWTLHNWGVYVLSRAFWRRVLNWSRAGDARSQVRASAGPRGVPGMWQCSQDRRSAARSYREKGRAICAVQPEGPQFGGRWYAYATLDSSNAGMTLSAMASTTFEADYGTIRPQRVALFYLRRVTVLL